MRQLMLLYELVEREGSQIDKKGRFFYSVIESPGVNSRLLKANSIFIDSKSIRGVGIRRAQETEAV